MSDASGASPWSSSSFFLGSVGWLDLGSVGGVGALGAAGAAGAAGPAGAAGTSGAVAGFGAGAGSGAAGEALGTKKLLSLREISCLLLCSRFSLSMGRGWIAAAFARRERRFGATGSLASAVMPVEDPNNRIAATIENDRCI